MSEGVFVVGNPETPGAPTCRSILGYRNVLSSDTADRPDDDPNHPLSLALDYSYTTEYRPLVTSTPGTTRIDFNITPQDVNYFMLISKNAEESGLTYSLSVLRFGAEDYELIGESGAMKNGVPSMMFFDSDGEEQVITIRLDLSYTMAAPYIMSLMAGQAIVFPRTMSLGFQPAHLSWLDDVRQFDADEGLNLVGGRRLARGKQLSGTISYVRMSQIEQFWEEFANHVLDSKPFALMWNDTRPDQVIYGTQVPSRLTKPRYKTNLFSSVDFEVVGWA